MPPRLLLLALLAAGCGRGVVAPSKPAPLPTDPWVLGTNDPDDPVPAFLSNGTVGIRVGRNGGAVATFSATEYEPDGEEKIRPLPPRVGTDAKPRREGYRQTLDLREGFLRTRWTEGGGETQVSTVVTPQGWVAIQTGGEPDGPNFARTRDFWRERWETTDIEIEGPVEDQQSVRAMLWLLTAGVPDRGAVPVPPFGLSSARYHGHVFWDADMWIFPALAPLDPDRAGTIARYRLARLAQARRNYEEWAEGRPGAPPTGGVKFPWESSVTGRETTPAFSKDEDHVTGSVAWMFDQAAAWGIVPQAERDEVWAGARTFYLARSVATPAGRSIRDTVSPDEFHKGDDDLYTNLLAETITGQRFVRPADARGWLTYAGDKVQGYKQAAAVLTAYPLQHPEAEARTRYLLDRFSDKTTRNGPAMSHSVHALLRARLGDAEAAYREWRDEAVAPFTDHAFRLFSEKPNKPETAFLTGAGGCLQTVLYGFLGMRVDARGGPGAYPLANGRFLTFRPNLPTAWRSVTLKGLRLPDGRRLTLRFEGKRVRVVP